jgi:hypothetical protein
MRSAQKPSVRRRASVDLAELCAYPVLLNSKSAALRIMD